MSLIERLAVVALRQFDPELAHGLAMKALELGLATPQKPFTSDRLKTNIAGLDLPNPVGLAAGFDKNAKALGALAKSGFGFIEVGAATPLPQPGNPKPRLFRLTQDQAVINRFGFNNEGAERIAKQLSQRPEGIVTGLNLGANKTSSDRAADFAKVFTQCAPYVDFATVNVSSPNTEKLRELQGKAALSVLLDGVMEARDKLKNSIPVFLKIAPDLDRPALADIAEIALTQKIDAIIATNTSLARIGLVSKHRSQAGGLSGKPLFEVSTQILAQMAALLEGKIPLIGVGGVSNAQEAYHKICAGASAVQLYTALVYHGMSLPSNISKGLDELLKQNGYSNVSQAVGSKINKWL
jgi:dihydroorotate dehydrogenase